MSEPIVLAHGSESVRHLCGRDPRLAEVICRVGELAYTPAEDGFGFLMDTIIGQMLSNRVANVLCGRMRALCAGGPTPAFVAGLAAEELRGLGLSAGKAACIKQLAEVLLRGEMDLAGLAALDDDGVIAALTALRGIGPWTAKMYLIFALNRPDVLPHEDGAFLQAYRWMYNTEKTDAASVSRRCRQWRPHRSTAARFLYRALDLGMTKERFAPPQSPRGA